MAQADYYLKIDTIEGESDATGFEKQMQIESWSFGANNSGSAAQGSGLGTGKVSLQDFHFVVQNGNASPQLFLACAKGYHIPQPILSLPTTVRYGHTYTYSTITCSE